MKCFNHQTIDAIAICKNCNKALCADCLVEVKNGVACKNTCVEEVIYLNTLVEKSKTSSQKAGIGNYRAAIIYGAIGLFFLISALTDDRARNFMMPMGILFLGFAALYIIWANKAKK